MSNFMKPRNLLSLEASSRNEEYLRWQESRRTEDLKKMKYSTAWSHMHIGTRELQGQNA